MHVCDVNTQLCKMFIFCCCCVWVRKNRAGPAGVLAAVVCTTSFFLWKAGVQYVGFSVTKGLKKKKIMFGQHSSEPKMVKLAMNTHLSHIPGVPEIDNKATSRRRVCFPTLDGQKSSQRSSMLSNAYHRLCTKHVIRIVKSC